MNETKRGKIRLWWILLSVIGIVVAAAGWALRQAASPSPHGYIEVLFALPTMMIGLLCFGAGLIGSGYRVLQVLGGVAMAVALYDLARLAILVIPAAF